MSQKQTHAFQAEIKDLLDLMIHSLYSHKEIFLRELISNASDAIDKLKFEALTQPHLIPESTAFQIRLESNPEKHTLTLIDNGIGMTRDEVMQNLGTIAHSGTKRFVQLAKEAQQNPELIGQFGVGFYSVFMVADRVTVHTQKAGHSDGVLWEPNTDGTYSITEVPRPLGTGTTITIHLKDKEACEGQDFSQEWTIKELVRKYSDFIAHPIVMKTETSKPKLNDQGEPIEGEFEKVVEDETLNSMKALWLKSPNQIKPEEYTEFYRHLTHDWSEPAKVIHYRAEGKMEFNALLYIPSIKPFDYNYREHKFGLNLYVKRVFIMNDCEELIPPYLRFVKGLVDSSDLSLNVSREMLQKDQQLNQISKSIASKILNTLKDILTKEREAYEKIWHNFGSTLKEGIAADLDSKEKIEKLLLFKSTHSEALTTLAEYVARMKEGQKDIFFISGDSLEQLQSSPYLERLLQKNYEVLYMIDPVDEWMISRMPEFDGKKLINITSENLELETEEEKKKLESKHKEELETFSPLLTSMRDFLKNEVKDVRISNRLADSPVCLVSGSTDPSMRMEKLMESMGYKDFGKSKRILEVNPAHPVMKRLLNAPQEKQEAWSKILYNQALLAEGSPLPNPGDFSKQIADLMVSAATW